ncbi:ubiquitin carboxyl-terminal hydrolase 16 [Diospyros lotus]|uniref:ubiquitin carboxyl-terminal hydrolase 16 n=1 Tax=Diospyros lotus TaxID=55363 RepID=UPI00224C95B6|nr:ubiquitin carboxyl-terminal hydrolase 16 [Diospyros lotus]
MPVGGDLGFPYLVLVVSIVGPVVGFVLLRKWQLSVARSEEIKRLLVLASEEAARAELEASVNYVASVETIPRPLLYQCAVCYSPTTTRCSRCKAVRYCSGKCQIIHWRQGHKEECHPFTATHFSNDEGDDSIKVFKQKDSFEIEGRHCAEPIQNFSKDSAGVESDCSSEVLHGNHNIELKRVADEKGMPSSSCEIKRSDGHQSTNILPDKHENIVAPNVTSSNCTILVNSVDDLSSSGKLNQIKPNGANCDTHCGSTSSSGWSADGSNGSSFSEPSTPSSGFWEGTINSTRPKLDAVDNSDQYGSNVTGETGMNNSQSSQNSPFNSDSNTTKRVISDDAHATTLGMKKPIDRAFLSEGLSESSLKGRSLLSLGTEKSDNLDACASSDSTLPNFSELRHSTSRSSSSAGRPSTSTSTSKISSKQSLSPGRSNSVINDTSNTSLQGAKLDGPLISTHASKISTSRSEWPNGVNSTSTTLHSFGTKEGGSSSSNASVAHLPSSTRRHSLQGFDSDHAVAGASQHTSYLQNGRNGLKTSMQKVVDQHKASKSPRNCQPGVGSEIAGKYSNKGLFSYDLFVKLYNWNKIELRPFGLANCGNSCYANAALQCLARTPPLTAYLLEGLHSKACARKEWCFTCEFESLMLKAKGGTLSLSPVAMLSQIRNIGSQLGNWREEDAHEFLRYAIDAMQSVCLKESGVNASSSREETTLVGLTFGGYLRSKIKCMKCGGKSEQHERMMDLTVEIEGDIGTLEEALRRFTGTEILDGENKYKCSRCRSYERAKKKLKVLEAPNVLTIALKRFQSGKFGKLNKSIRFPEILDLAPYMSGTSDKSPIYKLYGVVVHLDVMNATFSGHYVCYAKNIQNKWFKFDDSTVKPVDLETVLTKRAYILLYARCSPRAPRLIRNSLVPRDSRKPKNLPSKSRSHSTDPWDASAADSLNGHAEIECLYPNHRSFQPIQKSLDEDCSSDNSSSIFSEGCSCSTESSNRDSTSTDDYFDHIFGDSERNWNSSWKMSSDSDFSSSSSSSSSSPLYSRHSPLADSDRYSSGYAETSGFQAAPKAELDRDDGNGFWTGAGRSSSGDPISTRSKQCRNVGKSSGSSSSGSCRETDSNRLGWSNLLGSKKSVVSLRRSTRERTEAAD